MFYYLLTKSVMVANPPLWELTARKYSSMNVRCPTLAKSFQQTNGSVIITSRYYIFHTGYVAKRQQAHKYTHTTTTRINVGVHVTRKHTRTIIHVYSAYHVVLQYPSYHRHHPIDQDVRPRALAAKLQNEKHDKRVNNL